MTVSHLLDRDWFPPNPWACPSGQYLMSATAERSVWLAARQKGLGASDVAAVFGVSRWATPWDIWSLKTGRVQPEPENDAMRRGRLLEDGVADLWVAGLPADQPVRLRRAGLMKHRVHDWMLATVDRLSVCRQGRCTLQIKTANDLRDWDADEVPVAYQLQVQQELAVTGRDHAHVVVLGDRFRLVERTLPRDDELIASMVSHLGQWWQRHIVEDVEPDATAGAAEGLARLYGDADPAAVIDLPEQLLTVSDEVRGLNKQIAELAERRDDLVARVKQVAGNASVIRALGQTIATWRPTKKIAGADKRWREVNAELLAPYRHTGTVEVIDLEALIADHPELIGSGAPLHYVRQLRWID